MAIGRWFDVLGFGRSQARGDGTLNRRQGRKGRSVARRVSPVRTRRMEQLEDRALLSVTLNSDRLQMTIASNGDTNPGFVTSVKDPATQTEYLNTSVAAPFAKIFSNNSWFNCTSCTFASNTLSFGFANGASLSVDIQQGATDQYLIFSLNTVSLPKPTEIDLLNFQTNLTTYISPLSGMTASNDFAVYFRPLTPYCPTGDCASTVFVANTTNPNYMDSAHMKCALGGSPYGTDGATVRSRLKTLVTNEGLPTSSAGGPYALDTSATINKLSYVFADVTEANVDDWIALAEKYDIGILHFSLGWEASDGHWAVGTSRFSNGLDGMQSVIQKIHDAGLKVGIHTTTIGISPDDSYVTPTPDSRLYKDASFTLATAIPATGAIPTITVNAPIQGIDPTAGNVLQIDNELFQYSGYSDNQFTGCTRQAFNTLPAAHNSGVTVSHLREYYGLFYPDPDSTLVNEIAQNLADIVNTCNIDEVSLDAAEAAPCFAAAKKAIVEKFTHAVRIESSSADIYSWTYLSSFGYTDPPTTADKSVSDLRTAVDANNREAIFMPIDLGSSDFRPSTPSYNAILPDEMEYHCAKTLAIGASYSIDSVHLTPANGRQDDYLAMVKNYQSLMVDSTTKSELLVAGDEFHLETLPDGSLHLVQVQNIGHKVTGISGDGSGTWPVNDPYGTQSPTMRIETLSGVAPYTGTSQQTLAGQSNVSSFLTSSATNVSTPTLSWSTSQVPPVDQDESGSMVFSATNNGTTSQGAWAEASQALLLNASDKGAIGVWIKGDGNGETINIQLCSNSAINEHYVTVDANFTDWRYFELPFSEGDADKYANYVWPYAFDRAVWREPLNLQQITGINIFYNNIPAGGTATCYISTIKALPVSEITLTNPTVTVSGAMVTFPVSMTSGQYIECNSMTDCRLYDKNGFLLQSVTPMGTQPILAQGSNAVSFSATPQSGYNLRANVSMGVSCKQGTQDTSHLAWDAATVGKWDFEDVGGALARDASPYLNHATLSPTVQRVSSKTGFGDALQLNGIDASVNIPASNSLNSLTGSFSVEMWFKYGGSGTAGKSYWTLVNKNATDQSSNDTFHIWVGSNGCLSACVGNGLAYYQLDSNTSVNDGAYHLVDLVYDDVAKGYTLYLDGAIKATRLNLGSTWIVARNTDPVTLGYWQGYANYFNGTIDGVQILSCPLSQAEVTARLSNNLPVVTVTSPTCQSAYMAPTSIPLLATATDSDGLIKKVAFYQGDTWLADGVLQSNNVYAASWANIPATFWGTYAITAKAIDDRETIVSSSIIYVTINATPVINTQPSSQAVDSSSQKATFSVTATGPGTLTYQWKHNGTDIAGANRFYFTVDSPINGDVYRVVVTNSYGSTVSSDATVCSAVAYWKLDDATGTSVADASGNGNTGTFRNGPTWTSGMVNGAIMFDGLNDHITVPDVAALKYAGGELTLSTWAYIDPAETDGGWLISKFWNGASILNYGVYLGDDYRVSLILQSSDGDWWNHSARLTSSNALSVGTWHHIAFTVDTAQLIKLYVDGILVDSGTRSISTWTDNYDIPLAIGTWYPYGDDWPGITGHSFQGMMDDVRIYNHTLSPEAIAEQARCCVGYWKLDDATGASVADASGNGNTGTFRNGPSWTSGMVNGAIMFDGLNDHITVPDVAALKYAGGELTLSTWAYIDPAETDGGWLISKFWNGASMLNYGVYLGDDYRVSLILQSSDGDWWNHSARLTSSNALSVGTWHHIAFTVDTAQLIKLYVDGILVDSGTRLISTWTDNYDIPLAIGTWYPYGDGWPGITGHSLQGMMDDVCICAHMLTANDIQLQASVPIITPWLATEPANQAVDPGQTATFVVTATGPGNFTYQWQEYEVANSKWSDIVGAIGAYYTPTAAHGDNGLQYRVIVRNCYGGVAISRPARLYVNYGSELWWKLDESSGIAADTDGSGDNYTGTLARSAGWYSTGSIFNGGATFDGDDSCISTPSLAALKYTGGELTLSTWIWGNSSDTNDAVLISKPWDGTGTLFNYQIGYTSGTSSTTGNVFFSLQGSAPAAAYSISSTVGISTGAANDAARHFAGKLDNVRIYRSSLSATDIHRLAIDPPAMASSSKAAQPMGAAILPSSSTTIESTIGKGRCYAVLVGALFQRPTGVLTDVMTRVNNGLSVTKDLVDKLLADKHPRIVDGVSITRGRRIDATFAAVEETLTSDDDAAVESLMDSDFFFPHGLERTRVLTAVDAYFHQGATP